MIVELLEVHRKKYVAYQHGSEATPRIYFIIGVVYSDNTVKNAMDKYNLASCSIIISLNRFCEANINLHTAPY